MPTSTQPHIAPERQTAVPPGTRRALRAPAPGECERYAAFGTCIISPAVALCSERTATHSTLETS